MSSTYTSTAFGHQQGKDQENTLHAGPESAGTGTAETEAARANLNLDIPAVAYWHGPGDIPRLCIAAGWRSTGSSPE